MRNALKNQQKKFRFSTFLLSALYKQIIEEFILQLIGHITQFVEFESHLMNFKWDHIQCFVSFFVIIILVYFIVELCYIFWYISFTTTIRFCFIPRTLRCTSLATCFIFRFVPTSKLKQCRSIIISLRSKIQQVLLSQDRVLIFQVLCQK